MQPLEIIERYYDTNSESYYFLTQHGKAAAKGAKSSGALQEVKSLPEFIEEVSMLHDIGMFLTSVPEIGCSGGKPYICHGYPGREILEREGLSRHALVCERHVGAGITMQDIEKQSLPLPKQDMMSISIEEQIICFTDKFFSKHKGKLLKEKPVNEVREILFRFGEEKVRRFEAWVEIFGG